jgi:hypothetical protein
MRVIYTKKECRKDRSARNTIGARYLPKNTVLSSPIRTYEEVIPQVMVRIFETPYSM